MKKFAIGCGGLIALFLLIAIIIAIASPGTEGQRVAGGPTNGQRGGKSQAPEGSARELPGVGQTAAKGGWEVTLVAYGPWEEFSARAPHTAPQGKLVVVEFIAKNLHNSTSNFTTSDFEIQVDDGRRFKPAEGTASIDKGIVISQRVQPGLTTENRLVFDIDPAASGLKLRALALDFRLD